jgi:hypothetical protein
VAPGEEVIGVTAPTTVSLRPRTPIRPVVRRSPVLASPVTGGELLALALSLRARGMRGLDVLRRSQDRAPPPTA